MPLPPAWLYDGEDKLDDMDTINRVMAEEGIGLDKSDIELTQKTGQRLAELGRLVRGGLLGKYASGGDYDGYVVEGLRTELPFYYVDKVEFSELYRTNFSVTGPHASSQVAYVDVVFDGLWWLYSWHMCVCCWL